MSYLAFLYFSKRFSQKTTLNYMHYQNRASVVLARVTTKWHSKSTHTYVLYINMYMTQGQFKQQLMDSNIPRCSKVHLICPIQIDAYSYINTEGLISKNISMELFMCKFNCGMLSLPKVKLWNAGRVFELLEYFTCNL